MSTATPKRCKWCGRQSDMPNPLKAHSLATSPCLPFRSQKSLQCTPCHNAIALQAGGDAKYKAQVQSEVSTEAGVLAQRERTEEWERKYNSSVSGRVVLGNRGLRESTQVTNSSWLSLDEVLGIVWPVKEAEKRLGRKPTRTEAKVFMVGSTKVKGVLFPEVSGEAIPFGCFRLRRGTTTQVDHTKEYDNEQQELREGQVAATASSLAKRILPINVRQVGTKRKAEDGDEEVDGPDVRIMSFKSQKCKIAQAEPDPDGDSSDDQVDLLGGPVPTLVRRGKLLRKRPSDTDSGGPPQANSTGSSSKEKRTEGKSRRELRTPLKVGRPKLVERTGEAQANLGGSLKVLLAQAENMVDQILSRGLLAVNSKSLLSMAEKVEGKLTSPDYHLAIAEGADSSMSEVGEKLQAVCRKLRWALPATVAMTKVPINIDSTVAALITLVQTAASVGLKSYSLPEAVSVFVAKSLWFGNFQQDPECQCFQYVTAADADQEGDMVILNLGANSLKVQITKETLGVLQEETILKSMVTLVREAPMKSLHVDENGREICAKGKFERFVCNGADCGETIIVDGLREDFAACRAAFLTDADQETVREARQRIAETSKRLTSKQFRSSAAITDCLANLDSRLLHIKLNEQAQTNLQQVLDTELPDMAQFPSARFTEVSQQHGLYAAAVDSFKEAMAKAPPTFAHEFAALHNNAKAKVHAFFDIKSDHLFNHIASECQHVLEKMTGCLDASVADLDSSGTTLQKAHGFDASTKCVDNVCKQKVLGEWNFDAVVVDLEDVMLLAEAEKARVADFEWVGEVVVAASLMARDGGVSTSAMEKRLALRRVSDLSSIKWFPPRFADKAPGLVAAAEAFLASALRIDQFACQFWLSAHPNHSLAASFCEPVVPDTACSHESQGASKSEWLTKLEAVVSEMGASGIGSLAIGPDVKAVTMSLLQSGLLLDLQVKVAATGTIKGVHVACSTLVSPLASIVLEPKLQLPEPKWDETATTDPTFRRYLAWLDSKAQLQLALQSLPEDLRQWCTIRLDELSAWHSFCCVSYMRLRCTQIQGKVQVMQATLNSATFQKMYSILDREDFASLTDQERKELLEAANKSKEIGTLVALHACWGDMLAWPGDIKGKVSEIDPKFAAQVDLLDAQVRSVAVPEIFTRARQVIANCTAIQALVKTIRGGRAPSSTRATQCEDALSRAKAWGISLKPSLAVALAQAVCKPSAAAG